MKSKAELCTTEGGTALRARAVAARRDERVIRAVHLATLQKVDARAAALAKLRDPEGLRSLAAEIKRDTLANLPRYLKQFAEQVQRRGGTITHCAGAADACAAIGRIADACGAKLAVKSKSMTTEEVDLNAALERRGVRIVETDLGEFIVQLDHDRPSHIVTPIIHKDRQQVAETMVRELGCAYSEDPTVLTQIARAYLRDIFRRADLGISGVNFAVAETGTLCICTNEGNGRMTTTRPRVHVALMGMEKLVPQMQDLPVFLKLLARSSTGQPITVYTSLITGPRRAGDADGPEELHVIVLDNGRSKLLGTEFEEVLACIRCGACLNACPVYRNVGGHAYASVYPGPIGALVTPLLRGGPGDVELPRASSLCGACRDACPVKIDIPRLLVRLRARSAAALPRGKRWSMRLFAWFMRSPRRYALAQRLLRWALRRGGGTGQHWSARRSGPGALGEWLAQRDLPAPPAQSFRQTWEARLRDERSA